MSPEVASRLLLAIPTTGVMSLLVQMTPGTYVVPDLFYYLFWMSSALSVLSLVLSIRLFRIGKLSMPVANVTMHAALIGYVVYLLVIFMLVGGMNFNPP